MPVGKARFELCDSEPVVQDYLRKCGVSESHPGFRLITTALCLFLANGTKAYQDVNDLYTEIEKLTDTPAPTVNKIIRFNFKRMELPLIRDECGTLRTNLDICIKMAREVHEKLTLATQEIVPRGTISEN